MIRVLGADLSLIEEIEARHKELSAIQPLGKKDRYLTPASLIDNLIAPSAQQSVKEEILDFLSGETEPQSKEGVVYIAQAPWMPMFKVGRWRSDVVHLKRRYNTYYGPDVCIHAWKTEDCIALEKLTLRHLASYHHGGELFRADGFLHCVSFLNHQAITLI